MKAIEGDAQNLSILCDTAHSSCQACQAGLVNGISGHWRVILGCPPGRIPEDLWSSEHARRFRLPHDQCTGQQKKVIAVRTELGKTHFQGRI